MTQTRLFAFDLDDTLAHSKQPMAAEMAEALRRLLASTEVLIISGARFEQFELQVLSMLPGVACLERLHLMPTCGTRYLRFQDGQWVQQYSHDLPQQLKNRVHELIEIESKRLGLWHQDDEIWGERIEDRGSQVTYSALGQAAPVGAKRAWDVDGRKRETLRAALAQALPELEVRAGGLTSIDITERGIDKAYGVNRLIEILGLAPQEIEFVGDRLEPGGNDFPVVALGVLTHAVRDCDETLDYLLELLPAIESRAAAGTLNGFRV